VGLLEGKFIVDGVHWDYFPGAWEIVDEDAYGLRQSIANTLDLTSVIVVQNSMPTTQFPDAEKRMVHTQAWRGVWESDSFMDVCMRDQLVLLYTLQKGFWIQYDDEMSRELTPLIPADDGRKSFFTPTFPIFPYAYTPVAPTTYNGTVFLNMTPIWDGFTVQNNIGKVTFQNQIPSFASPYMKYTWKAFVRIAKLDIRPFGDLAQNVYRGEVVFEQLRSNYSYDPWWITYTCGDCPSAGDASLGGGDNSRGSNYNTLPNPTWGDSRYSGVSGGGTQPSGGVSGSSGSSGVTGVGSLTSGAVCPSGYTAIACLEYNTRVEMSDGLFKMSQNIKVGDRLRGYNELTGEDREQEVTETFGGLQPCIRVVLENNKEFVCSFSHRLYTSRGIVNSSNLRMDDLLLERGRTIAIKDLSWAGYKAVAGWNCTPDHNYYVDNVLHHNKQIYCVEIAERAGS
jgi:hypothetical protein